MRKKRILSSRTAVKMIAVVLVAAMLTMDIPNELLTGIAYVHATESEAADQKETAPEKLREDGTETETNQTEFENEQSDDAYLLMEEEMKILEEEAVNSSRFIVKYKDADNKNITKLQKATEKAFNQAKNQKSREESQRNERLKNVDPVRLEEFERKIEGFKSEETNVQDVSIQEMNGLEMAYEIIELEESIEPGVFMEQVAEDLGNEIEYIQPDYVMELAGDVSNSTEENIDEETDTDSDNRMFNRDQDLRKAWETSRGEGVTVALIDTGVDISHPMLEGQIVDGYDFCNDSSNVYNPDLGMDQLHGTHVSGIIAESAPDAMIMPLKVFENGKAYTSDIIRAIEFAEANGAAIVNMSFGSKDDNQALREAMGRSGMFFVCAAGNNRTNIDENPIYPASYGLDNTISVTALNQDLGMSYFSNYGTENVDISAWGRDVYSAFPDGEYGTMNGTSMSAGYVSAAAALAASVIETENLKETLKSTSDKLSCLEGKVGGGNKVSFSNAVNGISNVKVITLTPEDDYDVFGYQPTPEESWELFSNTSNVAVSAGAYHNLVLKEDGTLWAWGGNSYGQLGDGTTVNRRNAPVQVIGLDNVIEISAGNEHNLALKEDGTLWAWGSNSNGELGNGTITASCIPVKVLTATDQVKVTAISAGHFYSMAIKEDGTLWTWGYNRSGQLGNGTNVSSSYPININFYTGVTAISAGSWNSIALTDSGVVWSWGDGQYGIVGDGTREQRYTPVPLHSVSGSVEAISVGQVLKKDGTLRAWGHGIFDDYIAYVTPIQITGLNEIEAISDYMAIKTDGSLWAWGRGVILQNGQYDGTTSTGNTPVKLNRISNVKSVDTGYDHTIALRQDGTVWTWGNNGSGQLGDGGTSTYRNIPYNVCFVSNTRFEDAIPVTLDVSVDGALTTGGEYRYYKFTPTVTTYYTVQSVSSFDTYGHLYEGPDFNHEISKNDDGACIGESSNKYDFYIKYKLTAGTTYYIAVRAYSQSVTGTYALRVGYWSDSKYFYGNPGGYAPAGNYSQTFTDITIPSVLGDIPFSRTYNSLESSNASIVGKGFHFNYSMRIVNNTYDAYVIMPDSSWICFAKNADGTYAAMNCRGTLKKDGTTNKFTFETLDHMRYGFNSTGYLEYMEDPNGNRITITTDSAGKINAMSDPSGLSVSFNYSGSLLTKITDNRSGRSVRYTYADNCLTAVTDAGGFNTGYKYESYESGLLVKVTTVSNSTEVASITYNTSADYSGMYNGLIKTVTNDQGLVSTYDYSLKPSRQVKITDYNSITIQDFNSCLDIIQTKIAPVGKPNKPSELTKSVYNSYHEVTESEDILGNKTNYKYDGKGNVIKITWPEVPVDNGSIVRPTEEYKYDLSTNDLLEYTDKSGSKTFYAYDAYHNLITVTRPLKGTNHVVNRYEYYTDGTYPIKGLLKKETGPLGNSSNYTRYEYSFTPNAVSPNPVKTVKTIKCVEGTGWQTTSEYDRVGRLVKETTPMGIVTTNEYDTVTGLLKKTQVWDNAQLQHTASHEYDEFGNETKQTVTLPDGSERVTGYTYNSQNGNLISEINADGTKTEYDYDLDGNETLEKEMGSDNKELTVTLTEYDELSRDTGDTTTVADAPYDPTKITKTTTTTSTKYKYDADRKVYITTTTDELGDSTLTETDYDGRLMKEEKSNGLVQINTYDTSGRVKREECRDKNNINNILKWTEYTYDTWGRVTRQTSSFDASGNAERIYTYDIAGNVLTELVKTDTDKYTKTGNEYDAWGNLTIMALFEGYLNADGISLDGKGARCVQTFYDWDGQVLLKCNVPYPRDAATLKSWWNGTFVTGYNVTKYKYDNFRRLIEKTDALGKAESYEYDYAGRIVKNTDRNNVVHEKRYDEAGRIKTEVSAGKIIKAYEYGADGNVSSFVEGTLKSGTTIDNPVIENATTILYKYDGEGNIIKDTCGNVVKTFSETNLLTGGTVTGKETLEVITASGNEKQRVKKVYNAIGQLTAVYDNATLKASYTYDLSGQLLTTTNNNGTAETNTYNSAGLVTSTVNKRGGIVNSQYSYTYYRDGSQKTKTDSTGTTEYAYDGRGQLIKTVLGNRTTPPDNTSFENAAAITVDTPKRVSINATYQMRYFKFTPATTGTYIIASTDKDRSDPYGYLYASTGTQLASNDDGNGDLNFKISYTLNAGTEYVIGVKMLSNGTGSYTLTVTQQSGNDNTTLANAAFITAGAPARVSINAASQVRYFKFTPAVTGTYIIASATNGSSDPYCYLYTSGGAQLASNDDSDGGRNFRISYTLSAGMQYVIGAKMFSTGTGSYTLTVWPSGGDTVQEFTYDAEGNRAKLTETKNGTVTKTTYTYDKNNRLLTEKTGSQAQITYSYDNNGNMTGKTDGTAQTFDALNRMTRYQNGSSYATYTYYPDDMRKSKKVGVATATEHVWLNDEIALDLSGTTIISSYIHGNNLITSSYGWYQYNAHGDVVALTDGTGHITRNYDYDPFGVQIGYNAGVDNNPYRYSGEYYDTESRYTFLRARYYDPAIGRFISEDPAFDGNNWYIYCRNDPVNRIDPSGLASVANLSIVSYGSGGSTSLDTNGHAFIMVVNTHTKKIKVGRKSVKKGGSVTVGTFGNRSAHNGVWYNIEAYCISSSSRVSLTKAITSKQLKKVSKKIRNNDKWGLIKNCSWFAAKVWNSINSGSNKVKPGVIPTPAKLAANIKEHKGYQTEIAIPFNGLKTICYYNGSKLVYDERGADQF